MHNLSDLYPCRPRYTKKLLNNLGDNCLEKHRNADLIAAGLSPLAPEGEAKFWIEPEIELAKSYSLSVKELGKLEKSIKEHENEIIAAWHKHFS